MLVLGLTGSLAMGKTTVTEMFAAEGAATYDADAAVHAFYRGEAVALIEAAFPGTTKDGAVDRSALAARVTGNPASLAALERIVHPLARQAENRFRERAAREGRRVIVLDIPLLLETGGEARVDAVIVASAGKGIQHERIMVRPGMTAEKATALLARQMPDAEKRLRAHFIVDTSGSLDATRRQVRDIMRALAGRASV
jgi:dephospho-CoA kinase